MPTYLISLVSARLETIGNQDAVVSHEHQLSAVPIFPLHEVSCMEYMPA